MNQAATFATTDTKLHVPAITFSINDNAKLLQHLKSGFKCTIIWNKYYLNAAIQARNQYLDYLIDSSFQGVERLFVLSFGNNVHRILHTSYFLPTVETKYCNDMIDGKKGFD